MKRLICFALLPDLIPIASSNHDLIHNAALIGYVDAIILSNSYIDSNGIHVLTFKPSPTKPIAKILFTHCLV